MKYYNHPVIGFHAGDPLPGSVEVTEQEFVAGSAQKQAAELAATSPEALQAALTAAVQRHLDATARQRLYDGILSLCSYATSTDPKFQAEGLAGVAWRDAVWAACYAIMAEVQAGNRAIPTREELLAELPAFIWPDDGAAG